MKRNAPLPPLFFLLMLLGLFTGCFEGVFCDVLSWSPDGRYLSYIEPEGGQLRIWDPKKDKSAVALDTTGTVTATFLPRRFFAGQQMLVGTMAKHDSSEGIDMGILNVGSGKISHIVSNAGGFFAYDTSRKGWVYYIQEQKEDKADQGNYSLWGYNIRKNTSRMIYQSHTGMAFPYSDRRGRILTAAGEEKAMRIMEVDADKGTTRSLTSSTTPSFLPMWADNGKNIVYLEVKDNMETGTLCRLDLETKTTESLMSDVTFFYRVQITKDGKWAAATTVVPQEGLAQKPQPEK